MKKRLAYLAAFLLVTNAAALTYAQATAPAATPDPLVTATAEGKEKHPLMKAGERALLVAKKALVAATDDYSGHRKKAIAHIDAAIREIEDGIKSAEKSNGGGKQ